MTRLTKVTRSTNGGTSKAAKNQPNIHASGWLMEAAAHLSHEAWIAGSVLQEEIGGPLFDIRQTWNWKRSMRALVLVLATVETLGDVAGWNPKQRYAAMVALLAATRQIVFGTMDAMGLTKHSWEGLPQWMLGNGLRPLPRDWYLQEAERVRAEYADERAEAAAAKPAAAA